MRNGYWFLISDFFWRQQKCIYIYICTMETAGRFTNLINQYRTSNTKMYVSFLIIYIMVPNKFWILLGDLDLYGTSIWRRV